MALRADRDHVSVRVAVDRFLASKRCENPNTRRAYAGHSIGLRTTSALTDALRTWPARS